MVSTKQGPVVGEDMVVSADFWIMDSQGNELDRSDSPVSFLFEGEDTVFAVLNETLRGQAVGFEQEFYLEPKDAYGEYDAGLMRVESRARFPEPLEVGMYFEGIPMSEDSEEDTDEFDDPESLIYRVTDIAGDSVVLDANHPLAGMALRVKILITHIRPAETEEIAQGFAFEDDDDSRLMSELLGDFDDPEDDDEDDSRPRVLH